MDARLSEIVNLLLCKPTGSTNLAPIWLSQASYCAKIAKKAETEQKAYIPMTKEELFPRLDRATLEETRKYQSKVGSLMYTAVTTRPDIGFAVSRLSRFLTNPSIEHQQASDRTLCYLNESRHYALQLGGGDDFIIATDASFADKTIDRKRSQAYAMVLFGGMVCPDQRCCRRRPLVIL